MGYFWNFYNLEALRSKVVAGGGDIALSALFR